MTKVKDLNFLRGARRRMRSGVAAPTVGIQETHEEDLRVRSPL